MSAGAFGGTKSGSVTVGLWDGVPSTVTFFFEPSGVITVAFVCWAKMLPSSSSTLAPLKVMSYSPSGKVDAIVFATCLPLWEIGSLPSSCSASGVLTSATGLETLSAFAFSESESGSVASGLCFACGASSFNT